MEVFISRSVLEDRKAQVLAKILVFSNTKGEGTLFPSLEGAILRKENAGFGKVNLLARNLPKILEDAGNTSAIMDVSPRK